jgi:hypothetical protein
MGEAPRPEMVRRSDTLQSSLNKHKWIGKRLTDDCLSVVVGQCNFVLKLHSTKSDQKVARQVNHTPTDHIPHRCGLEEAADRRVGSKALRSILYRKSSLSYVQRMQQQINCARQ